MDRLAPPRGLVARLLGVLPERAAVVDRAERSRSSSSVTRCAMIRLPSSGWAKPEASSSRNEISCSGRSRPSSSLEPADLERRDDAQRAVVLAAVSVRVAVRSDPEDLLALRSVPGDEIADGVLVDLEAERLELAREVVERVPVVGRVGVATDRLARERVVGAGKRLDVALDPLGAQGPVDRGHRGRRRLPAERYRDRAEREPPSPP